MLDANFPVPEMKVGETKEILYDLAHHLRQPRSNYTGRLQTIKDRRIGAQEFLFERVGKIFSLHNFFDGVGEF